GDCDEQFMELYNMCIGFELQTIPLALRTVCFTKTELCVFLDFLDMSGCERNSSIMPVCVCVCVFNLSPCVCVCVCVCVLNLYLLLSLSLSLSLCVCGVGSVTSVCVEWVVCVCVCVEWVVSLVCVWS